jgi:hypothetical protein
MGVPDGAVEQIFGSHLTSALLIQRGERCTVYRFPPAPTAASPPHFRCTCPDSHAARGAAITFQFDHCSLNVSTCPHAPIERFRRAARPHDTSALLLSSPRGHPTGAVRPDLSTILWPLGQRRFKRSKQRDIQFRVGVHG